MSLVPRCSRRVVSIEAGRDIKAVLHFVSLDCGHRVARVVVGGRRFNPTHLWCDVCSDEGARRSGITAPPVRPHVLVWPPVRRGRGSSGVKWRLAEKA